MVCWPNVARRATICSFHWNFRSAKRPVIRICPKCGALLLDASEKCSFCEIPIDDSVPVPAVMAVERSVDPDVGESEPEWRREVSRRLHEYRARRGRLHLDDPQSGLPFQEEVSLAAEEPRERPRPRPIQRPRQIERVEICIQPELDFSDSPDDRAHPQSALVPVAGLPERRLAGVIDAIFLGLTFAGFMGLFLSLHGQVSLAKTDAVVYLVVGYLFYALYFFVFTTLAGATPGMQVRGLTIVRLDGSLPNTQQLLWRSFGYLLSGATLMLGFVWAIWDEDHFTWQDRISQTYVTAATPIGGADSMELHPGDVHSGRQTFMHR
jgi:uncharacterized RDD family membrane protein YckC